MAKDNVTDTKVTEPHIPSTGPTTYALDELISSAKEAFGVQPEVIIGALQFKFKGNKKRFTKAEVKAAIRDYRVKEVR